MGNKCNGTAALACPPGSAGKWGVCVECGNGTFANESGMNRPNQEMPVPDWLITSHVS